MLTTAQLLKKYQITANKSLGQNFLIDQNLTDKIANLAGDIKKENILEIGPGPGCLTRSIISKNPKQFLLIEKDQKFIKLLQEISASKENIIIKNYDALEIDYRNIFPEKYIIIANLPYNIATKLIIKWLHHLSKTKKIIIMVQREVAERITATVNQKQYGRISVICNLLYDTKSEFNVKPSAFIPPPKIHSSIISLIPKQEKLDFDIDILGEITQAAFSKRRKKISNSMSNLFIKYKIDMQQTFAKLEIDANVRAENVSPIEFKEICKILQSQKITSKDQ